MQNNSIINNSEIENLFKEYCEKNEMKFSKQKLEDFLKFLELDLYDWVRENFRQFILIK